jgi:uncharacterized protein YwgA
MSLINVISKRKAIQILLALYGGGKSVSEIQEIVGGSYTTINKRIDELMNADLIAEEYLTGEEFGKIPHNKRFIRITDNGRKIIQSLLETNVVKLPSLRIYRQKWIILILHVLKSVRGRTRLIKLLFLLRREIGMRKGNYFRFEAGNYGPFSKEIIADVEELEKKGFISIKKETLKNEFSEDEKISYEFSLTTKGENLIQEALEDLPPDTLQKLQKLRPFNDMPLLELLKYVYERYPEFIRNSVIVEKILKEWSL